MKIVLRNGMVVSGEGTCIADVLIEGEKIAAVAPDLSCEDARSMDVTGKVLFPGCIDAHTHLDLEVSNTVTADDFYTGTRAAIRGGTTLVIDFATQNHGETLKEALENWHKKAAGKCSCDYAFHMAISEWNENISNEIKDMMDAGVTTFKLYMTYPAMILSDGEIYEVIRRLNEVGSFAGVHCENASVIDAHIRELKAAGQFGPSSHSKARPDTLEAEAVHRLMTIAGEANAPVMVVHLTNEKALKEIQAARMNGQTVLAETCPQYLLLDESVYNLAGFHSAKYVCSPPIRAKENQQVLWDALAAGEIQTIATDHCSFTLEQKAMGREDFTKIPNGMPGLETRVELIYSEGVGKGKLTAQQACKVLSENPAKLYGLYPKKGCIAPGSDADIVVIDPQKEKVITAVGQEQNTDYVPFEGMRVKGCIDSVFLRGQLVVQNDKILEEKTGIFIKRGAPQLML